MTTFYAIPYRTMPCHAIRYDTIPYHAMPCHAMPCHAMPCHAMPCHAIPYHTIPYHAMPCHAIPYHTIPYHTIPHHTILYHTIPYHTIPYHTIPSHAIRYDAVQYNTIQYNTLPYPPNFLKFSNARILNLLGKKSRSYSDLRFTFNFVDHDYYLEYPSTYTRARIEMKHNILHHTWYLTVCVWIKFPPGSERYHSVVFIGQPQANTISFHLTLWQDQQSLAIDHKRW